MIVIDLTVGVSARHLQNWTASGSGFVEMSDTALGDPSGAGSWLRLSEGLIAGVHHALNNRMAALSAVGQVLEADLPASHPLANALSAELQRLENTAGMLRLLVSTGDAEPIQVESVTADLSRLFFMHHALRDLALDVEIAQGLYPLWVEPSALLRALSILTAVAGRHAATGHQQVSLRATGNAVTVEIAVYARGSAEGDEFRNELGGVDAESAGALLREWGGEVEAEQSAQELRLTLRLPTLPEARRREAAAASA